MPSRSVSSGGSVAPYPLEPGFASLEAVPPDVLPRPPVRPRSGVAGPLETL